MPTTYEYVSPGVINVKDGSGATTQLKFTATGEVQTITDALNRSTQFAYDANGYVSRITAPGNTIYQFSYDAQGRLLRQTDPLNQTVSFTYAGSSTSPTVVTDQKGNKLTYGYDSSGNLTGITYANNQSETFTYDASGRLTKATERSGDTFSYTYDSAGRVSRKTFKDSTFEQYTYDAKGNLTALRDVQGGTTALVYDANDRLTKITYPNGRFLQYAYDATGRRTQMKDQSGFTVNYSYDTEGRLLRLTNATGGNIIAYTYDAAGRLSRETNGNGTYTAYNYDNAGQLLKITNFKANNTVNSTFEYTYDSLGRQRTAKTPDGTWTYTYDATGQLTRAQLASTNASIVNQDLQYVYDAAGNRIRAIENGVTKNYTTNNQNQYTTVGTATYTYDADGNLTRIVDGAKTWTYTYSSANRLTRAVTPDGTFDYVYDALGNRSAVIQNGMRTDYLVDPFGLGDVVGEYNGATLVANYAHGIGLVGRFNGSNAAYYDSDSIGSTVGLTNAAGGYVNRYAYRPFGEDLLKTEGVANGFEYVGQWGVMDEASGLDYMRARFYTPGAGRFMNPDPIGLSGGDTNLYRYVNNQVVSLIDPTGLKYHNPSNSSNGLVDSLEDFGNTFTQNNIADFLAQTSDVASIIALLAGTSIATGIGGALFIPAGSIALVTGLAAAALDNDDAAINKFLVQTMLSGAGKLGKWWDRLGTLYTGYDISTGWMADLLNEWLQAVKTISPLVIDLDNDGIELVSLQNSQTFFDLDADGFAEKTGWVRPDDGLLALDRNNNGRIDDITELFGNATTDGFIILKQLDSNRDNVIDQRDTQFANLRVWKDVDSDGFTDVGELQSLATWNIRSINLNYRTTNLTNEGNRISSTSTYTLSDGSTRQIVDVWFSLDQTNTVYSRDFDLKTETLFLPTLRGYGQLPDLYISMSQDPVLLGMMRNLVQFSTTNYSQFHAQVVNQLESLLYRWAGVETIAINSRGSNIDARQLTFLEKLTGESFKQTEWGANPGPQASKKLRSLWNDVMREMLGRILVQGPMRSLFPDVSFNLNQDTLEDVLKDN